MAIYKILKVNFQPQTQADSALVTTQPSEATEIKQQTQEYKFGLWPVPCLNTNDI